MTSLDQSEDPSDEMISGPYSVAVVIGCAALAIGSVAALLWMVAAAAAHEAPSGWIYPLACCSNKDCTMLPAGAVHEGQQGFNITVLPGQHDFVTQPSVFFVPYGEEAVSPDGADHICLNQKLDVLCFFTGSRGF